jgi:hypothetical protein
MTVSDVGAGRAGHRATGGRVCRGRQRAGAQRQSWAARRDISRRSARSKRLGPIVQTAIRAAATSDRRSNW